MGLFTWKNNSPSANHIIDEDHREIHLKVQALRSAIIGGKGVNTMIECAQHLIRATVEHFVQEEKVLRAISYREFAAHKAQHRNIGSKLAEIRRGLENRQIQSALNLIKLYDTIIRQHEAEDAKYHLAVNVAVSNGVLSA